MATSSDAMAVRAMRDLRVTDADDDGLLAAPASSPATRAMRRHRTESEADADGWTALMRACDRGDDASVRALLDAGDVTLESKLSSGHTALIVASIMGHEKCVRALLSARIAPALDVSDIVGWTALMHAAHFGLVICAGELLQHKANPNCSNRDGFTALMLAAQAGSSGCVLTLLQWGARPDARAMDGSTALIVACEHNHPIDATSLLRTGLADADAEKHDGFTALMSACQVGNAACVRALVRGGARVDHVGSHGFTARMLADHHGHTRCAQELAYPREAHCGCWLGRRCLTHEAQDRDREARHAALVEADRARASTRLGTSTSTGGSSSTSCLWPRAPSAHYYKKPRGRPPQNGNAHKQPYDWNEDCGYWVSGKDIKIPETRPVLERSS